MKLANIFSRLARSRRTERRGRRREREASFLASAENLEPRIALTVNVFTHNAGGDSPGYAAFILDESGDDLYLRQTLQTIGAGSEPVSFLELADNPGFFSSFDVAFDTNSVQDGNNFQDIFVSQGVQNTHFDVAGVTANPLTILPAADNIGGGTGTLPPGLIPDVTHHVSPGTLGGSFNYFGSGAVITIPAGGSESISIATQNLLDEQDGGIGGNWPLVFQNNQTSITLGFGAEPDMVVTGNANLYTGVVSLQLRETTGASYPATTSFSFNYMSPVIADDPSTVTLATGLTVDAGFVVDLPSPDSTITVASPINSPSRATADAGLLDLRATNVLVNAPVVADDGTRVLESRFHNSPSVETNVVGDVFASNIVTIDPADALNVQVGARVFIGFDAPGFEWFPSDTNVVAVNAAAGELTLSHVVSTLSGDSLDIYNPSSTTSALVDLPVEPLVQSATIFLDGPGPFDIQPGAVVGAQGAIETDTYIPLNTFVAAVNTVTGRVDLTRPVSLPVGVTTIDFFNNGYDDTKVERFEATAAIESPSFNFHIADDLSSDIRDRGRLYVAGSSGLRGVDGGTANLLTANVAASDIVFEGDVAVATQSYLFQTTIAEAPYTFTTKNSSGVSTGSLSGTTLDVTLANATPPEAQNSVIQVVDLDTAVASMRISAEDTTAMNPPFPADGPDDHDPIPEGPFPFAITIRESDDLSIDANLASGGPVDVTVGGNLALTSTIQSSQDLTFTAGGAMTGTAWLTTVDGQISLEATDVSIDGLVQVLARPFDGITTDITVTATDGSIALGQGVRAVNKILIDQRSATSPATPGGVQSSGLLAAYDVQVFADGDVDIDTAAPFVDVSVASVVNGLANDPRDVTVVSDRAGEFSISTAGGSASVTARGVDVNSDTPSVADDVAALSLTLRETGVLFASAPEGSIDVTAVSSDTLVMGVAADLLAGTAANMEAAGSVKVRTTQAPVTVLDAAIAGQGSLQVRAVTTAELTGGTYAQNTPGITPSTITATTNGSINGAAIAAFGGLDAATNPLRFRDLVLLNQQTNAAENGIYQIISLGNESSPWQLRRYALAEATSELPVGNRIYVTDGDGRGNTYRVSAYANVLNTTPLRVSSGMARSADEIAVRFATEAILDGTFDPAAGTITGALGPGVRLRVNETPVEVGDLILVQFGAEPAGLGTNTTPSSVANGVYQVTTADGAWVLTRYDNPEPPPAGSGVVEEATVLVNEGFFRTSRTGQTFQVAYDGLGLVDLTIVDDTANVVSELGSYDPRDTTTLVVSTAGGTNQSAGSLGKMLTLAQDNAALDLAGQEVLQALRFGNVLGSITGVTGTIGLRQELPNIDRPLVIDATQRYNLSPGTTSQTLVIDGSRITSSSESTFVTRADEVNGLVFLAGASADTTTNPFRPLESTVSALRFGGFEQGAAVVVDGASNVLLENLTVGQNSNSDAQAVRYGVRVTGDSGKLGPVTVLGGTFTSATIPTNPQLPATSPAVTPALDGAGALIDGNAQNTQIVGSTVGSQTAGNVVGVLVRSSNSDTSLNQVGARPIDRFTTKTTLNLFTLTLPAVDSTGAVIDMNDVHLGQTVSGTEIASGTTIIAIDRVTRVVTLSDAAIGSNSSAIITLDPPERTTVGQNFWGIRLESGATRVVNTDVENNILDGILIGDGLGTAVFAAIGASATADSSSNAIYSNGRNGIRFAGNVLSSTGPAEIQIQGNYVGRTVTSTTFVGNAQGSYYWEGDPPVDAAFASLGYDPETQTPVPPSYITADPLFDSLITPVSAGGTVDANGNVNADFVSGNGGGQPLPPGPPPPDDGNT